MPPVFFVVLSAVDFSRFGYTPPPATASIFVGFGITMDSFVVVLIIHRSLGVFAGPVGTWIPFASIFVSADLTGTYLARRGPSASVTATRSARVPPPPGGPCWGV